LLVKAQAMIHAAGWLEETHGREAVSRALSLSSRAVNDRYVTAISIEWHPVEELYEWLAAIESAVGFGDARTAYESGAYSARLNTRGVMKRSLFYLSSPEFLLRRITGLWTQFNQQGVMHLRHFDERRVSIELADLPSPNRLLCASITGWVHVTSEAVGARGARVEHTHCRARGDARCLFEVTWNAKNGENDAHASK
jgi:predicted hydrocarbon binding protein